MKLECGYKGNIRLIGNGFTADNFNHNSNQFITDSTRSNTFNFLEQVHALYVTYAQKIGKFNYKLGVRFEYTIANSELITTSQNFLNKYISIFPSAHFSYDLGNNQQ